MKWFGLFLIGMLTLLAVTSNRTIRELNTVRAHMLANFVALQGQLARSELLVEQYRQGEDALFKSIHLNQDMIAEQFKEIERLKSAKVQTVYRCAEKRPVPAFEPEWHLQ